MRSTIEVGFTILGLSFWILFPIGMFLSVSRFDKDTGEVRRPSLEGPGGPAVKPVPPRPPLRPMPFNWHHPISFLRQWLLH